MRISAQRAYTIVAMRVDGASVNAIHKATGASYSTIDIVIENARHAWIESIQDESAEVLGLRYHHPLRKWGK